MTTFVAGLILASALSGADIRPDSLTAKAAALVSAVLEAPWETSFRDWAAHGRAVCILVGNPNPSHAADGSWCYRCDKAILEYRAEYFFYESAETDSSTCHLRQVRWSASCSSEEENQALLTAVAERITAVLGLSDPTTEDLFHPQILRSLSEARIWTREDFSLVLGLGWDNHAVELRGFHGALARALRASVRFRLWKHDFPNPWFVDDPARLERWITARADELDALHPDLESSRPLLQTDAELVWNLHVLLSPERARSTEIAAALLLLADGLASELQWGLPDQPAPLGARLSLPVPGRALTYEYDRLGGLWVYRHDLLWEAWQRFGETDAGERAFARLLEHGLDTSCCCEQGEDQFRNVIREGESFLKNRPASPCRSPVVLAVARGYDTWWSLSRSQLEGKGPYGADYTDASEGARQNAIERYEEFLRIAPGHPESNSVERSLSQLREGVDTKERRYRCFYD